MQLTFEILLENSSRRNSVANKITKNKPFVFADRIPHSRNLARSSAKENRSSVFQIIFNIGNSVPHIAFDIFALGKST